MFHMIKAYKSYSDWEIIQVAFMKEKKKPNSYHSHICTYKMSAWHVHWNVEVKMVASFASILAIVILADYLSTDFFTKV